jgi:carbon-monoxide dehydrogenase medium subunit
MKFRERPAVSVGVQLRVDAGRVAAARVAIGSMTDAPLLVDGVASALAGAGASGDGRELEAALTRARASFEDLDVIADLDGSADFKRHLAGVMLGRATRAAVAEATARA